MVVLYEAYHDVRSLEHKVLKLLFVCMSRVDKA